jgi:hypothetical protein
MRELKDYTISKETLLETIEAGRHYPALQIRFKDRTGYIVKTLSAGYSDTISVYREGKRTYVLSRNPLLGYGGLTIFEGSEEIEDVFIHTMRFKNLCDRTVIKRMRLELGE